jgi:hypothetical protein
METMSKRTLQEAASELRRELGIRRRCYGRWIADGKLDEIEATDRLERMETALDCVERAVLLSSVEPLRVSPSPAEVNVNDVPSVSPVLVTGHSTARCD